jgi:tripartite-type tricarboxylate transporter receptor subunit TctC
MTRLVLALLVSALSLVCTAQPQPFPSRTVTLVSPFPPGGSTDAIARIMAQRMGQNLGQTVIVENSGGAGGSIGARRVATAKPDGYTFVIGQWDNFVANGVVYNLDYDPPEGFRADRAALDQSAAHPLAQRTCRRLEGSRRVHEGESRQGHVHEPAGIRPDGRGASQKMTGTEVLLVPYKGGGPAMTDMIAGHIDLLMVQAAIALPQVRAGKVKALAVLQPERSPVVEGVPSVDEAGVPGLHLPGWFGFFAPKGTPREAILKLNAAMMEALADPCDSRALLRAGPRHRFPRAPVARSAGRFPEGGDREVGAPDQGGRNQDRIATRAPG